MTDPLSSSALLRALHARLVNWFCVHQKMRTEAQYFLLHAPEWLRPALDATHIPPRVASQVGLNHSGSLCALPWDPWAGCLPSQPASCPGSFVRWSPKVQMIIVQHHDKTTPSEADQPPPPHPARPSSCKSNGDFCMGHFAGWTVLVGAVLRSPFLYSIQQDWQGICRVKLRWHFSCGCPISKPRPVFDFSSIKSEVIFFFNIKTELVWPEKIFWQF